MSEKKPAAESMAEKKGASVPPVPPAESAPAPEPAPAAGRMPSEEEGRAAAMALGTDFAHLNWSLIMAAAAVALEADDPKLSRAVLTVLVRRREDIVQRLSG
jgi:hypothetical protein